jgi:predicted dinucleotide-binding enzyme
MRLGIIGAGNVGGSLAGLWATLAHVEGQGPDIAFELTRE